MGRLAGLAYSCLRWPLAIVTYVLTQTTTTAVHNLAERVREAGFRIIEQWRLPSGVCLVQCPQDALAFETPTGRRVEPDTIRRFKLNMMGKRAVQVGQIQKVQQVQQLEPAKQASESEDRKGE